MHAVGPSLAVADGWSQSLLGSNNIDIHTGDMSLLMEGVNLTVI